MLTTHTIYLLTEKIRGAKKKSNTEFSLNSHLEANALAFKGECNPSFSDDGLVGTHYKGNIRAVNNLFLKNLCAKVSPE